MARAKRRFGVGSLMGLVAACAVVFAATRANLGAGMVASCLLLIATVRVRALQRVRPSPAGWGRAALDWASSLGVALLLVLVGGLGVLTGALTLFFLPGLNILVGLVLAAYFVAKVRQALWPAGPPDAGIVWLEGGDAQSVAAP